MAALPRSAATTYGRVVVVFTTATATISIFATNLVVSALRYAREKLRRLLDELPLRIPVPATALSSALERVVARVTAPVLESPPMFVGSGLAFRRWR